MKITDTGSIMLGDEIWACYDVEIDGKRSRYIFHGRIEDFEHSVVKWGSHELLADSDDWPKVFEFYPIAC